MASDGCSDTLNPRKPDTARIGFTPASSAAVNVMLRYSAGMEMPRRRACASGLRTKATSFIPGSRMSATNCPRPRMRRSSSFLMRRAPTPCEAMALPIAPDCSIIGKTYPSPLQCIPHARGQAVGCLLLSCVRFVPPKWSAALPCFPALFSHGARLGVVGSFGQNGGRPQGCVGCVALVPPYFLRARCAGASAVKNAACFASSKGGWSRRDRFICSPCGSVTSLLMVCSGSMQMTARNPAAPRRAVQVPAEAPRARNNSDGARSRRVNS